MSYFANFLRSQQVSWYMSSPSNAEQILQFPTCGTFASFDHFLVRMQSVKELCWSPGSERTSTMIISRDWKEAKDKKTGWTHFPSQTVARKQHFMTWCVGFWTIMVLFALAKGLPQRIGVASDAPTAIPEQGGCCLAGRFAAVPTMHMLSGHRIMKLLVADASRPNWHKLMPLGFWMCSDSRITAQAQKSPGWAGLEDSSPVSLVLVLHRKNLPMVKQIYWLDDTV